MLDTGLKFPKMSLKVRYHSSLPSSHHSLARELGCINWQGSPHRPSRLLLLLYLLQVHRISQPSYRYCSLRHRLSRWSRRAGLGRGIDQSSRSSLHHYLSAAWWPHSNGGWDNWGDRPPVSRWGGRVGSGSLRSSDECGVSYHLRLEAGVRFAVDSTLL